MDDLTTTAALRSARPEDAESIAVLHTESWRRTYRGMMSDDFLDGRALANRRHVWHERLNSNNPDQFVCIAEHDSELVGFICAFADADPIWGSYIDNLHVVHHLHRRGVGRALMASAGAWLCRVQPGAGVYLWVMEGNASARAFVLMNLASQALITVGRGPRPRCRG